MSHHDFFNGDADGICALHQLRLRQPIQTTLVTGVKRDIELLEKVDLDRVNSATVLDISFDKNRAGVQALLDKGAHVQYFDHHFAGEILRHDAFDVHINTSADVCTSLLVNAYLDNAHLAWAVTGAFGDNLHDSARNAAAPLELDQQQLDSLEKLGTLINYNGYGSGIDDLFFDPAALYLKIKPYANPFDFVAGDSAYTTLLEGYASDIECAGQLVPQRVNERGAVLVLPDEKWSRRIIGVYGNQLAREYPDRAHALLCTLPDGGYLVSVRAPINRNHGADELCRQFETGGGRVAAAGINRLPEGEMDRFIDRFNAQFG